MRRRLFALPCLVAFCLTLTEAAAHDHLFSDADPSTHHACIHCSGALTPALAPPPPAPASFVRDAAATPRPAPFVPTYLNPAHSGNAPPLTPLVS